MCELLKNALIKINKTFYKSQQEARHVVLFQQKDNLGL